MLHAKLTQNVMRIWFQLEYKTILSWLWICTLVLHYHAPRFFYNIWIQCERSRVCWKYWSCNQVSVKMVSAFGINSSVCKSPTCGLCMFRSTMMNVNIGRTLSQEIVLSFTKFFNHLCYSLELMTAKALIFVSYFFEWRRSQPRDMIESVILLICQIKA